MPLHHLRSRRTSASPTSLERLLFLVDAKDPERFAESKAELDALLGMEELAKTPFLILGNKIDHPGAVSEEQLRHELGIWQTSESLPVPSHLISRHAREDIEVAGKIKVC